MVNLKEIAIRSFIKKLAASVAVLVPLMTASASAAPYTVTRGDTLSKIGSRNNLSWETIWKANPSITNPNLIFPGQTIEVPSQSQTVTQTAPKTLPVVGDAPVASASFSCEDARALINQYAWPKETAYQVMVAESDCDPRATNMADNHGSCMGSYGLFQINCTQGVLYDPAQNVKVAYQMYQASGWQPWSVTTCRVKVVC